ncbi:hypothetical protein FRC12_016264 [Ceratobasidium sp. 428]|nr:hypothetical protein FRC12_016264 [Ceratobasidium sp. 428]
MASLICSWKFGRINAVAFSPDVTRVALTSRDAIEIYDTYTGQRLSGPLRGHRDLIYSFAFSPDGRTLASGSVDYTLRLWDTETGELVAGPLEGHTRGVMSVIFSLDGHYVVSGSIDGDCTVRIWDARTGKTAREPIRLTSEAQSIALIPTSRLAVCGSYSHNNVTVCDMNSGAVLFECAGHTKRVESVSCSPDGRLLASGSSDDTIRFWDPVSGQPIGQPLKVDVTLNMFVVFSPDSRYIASPFKIHSIRIWDTETRQMCGGPLPSHTASAKGAAFTPDGNCLVSVYEDGTVKVWDIRTSLRTSIQALDPRAGATELDAEITSATTPEEIVSHLSLRGCADMTDQLDLATCTERPISSGGFGDIYRGDLKDGTQVAIKTIRLYVGSSEKDQKILKHAAHEIYAWSKCKHLNVQPLLGLVMFHGHIGMIARWEANGNLPHYLERYKDVDRCTLSSQISEGLSYLHASGVVHGDLKGANVLISQGGVGQLADFGNAKLEEYTLKFTKTSTKEAMSSRWAAPELFEGNSCTYATDVYALGMTILEAITGDVPWTGKSERAVLFAITIKRGCPERPEEYIPSNSEHGDTLWSLLKSCWEFQPEGRPSAADVAQAVSVNIKYLEKPTHITGR